MRQEEEFFKYLLIFLYHLDTVEQQSKSDYLDKTVNISRLFKSQLGRGFA